MVLDRLSQIALIFFGALLLVLLVLGMAVSCREIDADALVTPTIVPFPVTPGDTSATLAAPPASPTSEAIEPGQAGPTPTLVSPVEDAATTVPDTAGSSGSHEATPIPGADQTQPDSTSSQPGTGGPGGIAVGSTVRHAVSSGEWLLQIARCYGAPYNSVLSANNIYNPDYILPGAIINVPNVGSQGTITGPPCVIAYVVMAGDTWDGLAQRHQTSVAILQRANPGPLSVGRSIWVPRTP